MRFLIAVLFSFCLALAAQAGSTATYVCADSKGHKAIQDHPCADSTTGREITTVDKAEDPFKELLDRQKKRNGTAGHEISCWAHRKNADTYAAAANRGYRPQSQAAARDALVRHRTYIATNCAGVGF